MFKNSKIMLIILFFTLVLGFSLRYYNYTSLPRHGATFDEFAWTWLGINLIQKGVPISWSPHPQYKDKQHLIYQGAAFWIVKPYLEHPPFFGLVAGSFAMLNGVSDMYHVTLEKIRPLAVILGTFSIFIVFLLSREIYGREVAIISSLLYATVPTIVIGSRIVQNENFLIPFWLLSLYLITRYVKTENKWLRNIAVILSGLLALAKVPWLVVGLSLVLILLHKRKLKDALFVGSATLVISSLFFTYGFYYDKDLFINLWQLQLLRYDISFSNIFSIFTNPLLVDWSYLDGWIFFGWFSVFMLFGDFKKNFFIIIPFVSYFILYIFAIPNEPAHGWYRYPFYPFLLIALAIIIKEEVIKPTVFLIFFLLIVGLSLMLNTWQEIFGFSYLVYRFSIFLWTLPFLAFIFPSKKTKFFAKVIAVLSLCFFIFLNIIAVINYHG